MKTKFAFGLAILFSLLAGTALAQGALTLRLSRDFGYASGSHVQGTFTMHVDAPEGVQKVTFTLDGQPMGEDDSAPFALRFVTDNYPLGEHRLQAVGLTANGERLLSNEIVVMFATAEEGWQMALKIAGPILGLTFIMLLLSFLPSVLPNSKLKNLAPGAPRQYGLAGGTICGRCGRPYPRGFMAPNVVFGKLTRCPFCGKMQISPAASPDALAAAEAAEVQDAAAGQVEELSEEDKLRREIDDSRFV